MKRFFAKNFSRRLMQVSIPTLTATTGIAYGAAGWFKREKEESSINNSINDNINNKKWPIYPLDEVNNHCSEDSLWVTFKGEVFDVTDFVPGHPGLKSRLLMAGGQDLEPYWEVYRDHYRGHIIPWLRETFKIGELTSEDANKAANSFIFFNAYEDDPKRHPDLVATTIHPFNGEPLLERLTENYYTPNELHYVRNHLSVPDIEEADYELTINGPHLNKNEFTFTLNDIKTKFKKYDVVSTLQCAGNRREDFHGGGKDDLIFIGPHWISGAISNAKWSGCRLRDVLNYCGLDVDSMALGNLDYDDVQHIHFNGYDSDETGLEYGVSIPIDKAVDGLGDVILAYEMNGEPLPRDHGFPLRAIVPGFAGARNCKWLQEIVLANDENKKPWQWTAYRGFAPDIRFETDLYKWTKSDKVRLDQAPIVKEMPVQSLVCNPPINSTIGGKLNFGKYIESIEVKGVCWSGGGRGIHRCDVSIDGGKTFTAAELIKPIKQKRMHEWGWFHFSKIIELPQEIKDKLKNGEDVYLEVVSKAVNGDYNVQPESPESYYNARGVCINHWYRSPVIIDPNLKAGEIVKNIKQDILDHHRNKPTGGQFRKPWGEEQYEGKNPQILDEKAGSVKIDPLWSKPSKK